ncbi:FAD-binding oxidoreductase [Actinomycetospora sp. NBRC 106375]|uniref:FAD-binding oxidoreductase n=1 Tax=Actinomycetospora sp. NBRC 106375 TaxID=3032207 RepID=UPI0025579F03|nr:FAD-binding oxidoreductase [Actinomycetospora sp. NBRC 106375]
MSAEPLSGGGPEDPGPGQPAPAAGKPARRLAAVRTVPPPPTTPIVVPGRHAAAEDGKRPDESAAAPEPAAPPESAAPPEPVAPPEPAPAPSPAPAPASVFETPEAQAARRVRETWADVEPQVDELAEWFAALLFSLAPAVRSLFPARITEPARRLLRSLVLPMTTVDRPDQLRTVLEPLVREHRALGLHAEQYEALGVAMIGAMRRFAPAWDEGTEHAWVRAFSLAAGPMEHAVRAAADPAVAEGTVVSHRRLSWDLAVLHVAPDTPVPHRAGQYLTVEIPQRPRMWRPLSPATAPRPDGLLEFHVRAVEGGWVSRAMVAHASAGDRWRLGPASGRLGLDPRSTAPVLMVAGGTGGAPVLALCEDLARWTRPRPCTVFLGGRVAEDLTVLDRLRVLADRHPWLELAVTCEDDPLDEHTLPGTLPDAVVRSGDWSQHDVLLSGSPAMIRASAQALLIDGVPLDRIHYDPFAH